MQIQAPLVLRGQALKATARIVGNPANQILIDLKVLTRTGHLFDLSVEEYSQAGARLVAQCQQISREAAPCER